MMIVTALHSTGRYSPKDLLLFEQEVRHLHVNEGEHLVKAGEIASSVYFLLTGAVYQYRIDNEMDQVVLDLHTDQQWVLNKKSFVAMAPATSFIKAYTSSHLLVLDVHSIHRLIGLSPAFFQLGRILDSAGLRTDFFDQSLSPLEKYQFLLIHHPQLLQQFPLKMIASYLKLTPETLSRVRKKIVQGKIRS